MPPARQLQHFGPQVRCLTLSFFETPSGFFFFFFRGLHQGAIFKIAEHYKIGDKRLKGTVKSILRANLYDINILPGKMGGAGDAAGVFVLKSQVGNLSFEQQKELLLQLQHEKFKLKLISNWLCRGKG